MGNACCKSSPDEHGKRKSKRKPVEINAVKSIADEDSSDADESVHDENREELLDEDEQEKDEINILRIWLKDDLPMFVINNALMSVQFFENFEEETEQLREELRKAEAVDVPGHRFQLYQTDKLMELVGTHVVFRPKHGAQKNTETLLHPLRSYLLYQNVNVEWDKDPMPQQMEKPFYVLRTEDLNEEEHLTNAGYLSLKVSESEVIYESIDEAIQSPRNSSSNLARPSIALLPVPQQEETTYGYQSIRKLTQAKSPEQLRRGYAPINSCVIPLDTMTQVARRVLPTRRRTGASTTMQVSYLNSVKFIQQFLDVLLDCLSEPLSLGHELESAIVQGGRVIFKQGVATNHLQPALPGRFWPDAGCNFMLPGNGAEHAWPRFQMQMRIRRMGVMILPLGYLRRRGSNPDFQLQWRYACPQAEQYLLLHTMHAHVRCYLFTLTIFKTYLEDTFLGLDHTHILHLLFHEVQKNFLGWPEDRPAENLLDFLRVLSEAIAKRNIRDFFLHDRNMLESSPYLFLNKVQGQLSAVLENPLPYILLALKHLQTRGQFYPQLDFTELYQLATLKNVNAFIHPHWNVAVLPPVVDDTLDDEDYGFDEDVTWREHRARELKEQKLQENEMKRASVETINVNQTPIKDSEDDLEGKERRIAILTKFIDHFVEMAKKSIEYNAIAQAQIYLQQAKRLNILYREEDPGTVGYFKLIKELLAKCEEKSESSNPASSNKDNTSGGIRLSVHSRPLPPTP